MSEFVLNRQSWISDLGHGELQGMLERISAADEDALYEGFLEHCRGLEGVELREVSVTGPQTLGSSASMLVPGSRIFVKIRPSASETVWKSLEVAVLAVLLQTLQSTHLGLPHLVAASAPVIVRWLRNVSLLSADERNVVTAVLRAKKKTGAANPTDTQVAEHLSSQTIDYRDVISQLEKKGILEQSDGGWRVTL